VYTPNPLYMTRVMCVCASQGSISAVYTPLKDRPIKLAALGTDPEEWHWVPEQVCVLCVSCVFVGFCVVVDVGAYAGVDVCVGGGRGRVVVGPCGGSGWECTWLSWCV